MRYVAFTNGSPASTVIANSILNLQLLGEFPKGVFLIVGDCHFPEMT